MKTRIAGLLLVVISFAWGRAPVQVEVPINIGVGPALHTLPAALADHQAVLPGVSLEFYGVILPAVIQQNRERIPRRWRSLISMERELHIKPFWLTLLPSQLLLHPGLSHEVWAASWSLFGLHSRVPLREGLEAQLRLKLPTLTYAWVQSPWIEEGDRSLWGLGLTPGVVMLWQPTARWNLSLSWDQNAYLPIALNEYTPLDRSKQHWIWHGVASLILHLRIPTMQAI